MPVEDLRAAGFGDEVEKVATAVAAYLDAVRDVGDTFTTAAEIPPLDAGEIETVVEAHHGPDLPDVVDAGSVGRVKTVVFDSRAVSAGDRSVAVPYPKPNPAWTASWSVSDAEESIRAVTFEKLRRVSNGNPGVALAVREDSVADGEVAPGYIRAFETDLDLDDDAAVLLWTALAVLGHDGYRRVVTSQPSSVTMTVCSRWLTRAPSSSFRTG